MRSTRFILMLGILVLSLPFLGFPKDMKDFLYVLSGILIIFSSKLIAKKDVQLTQYKKKKEDFSENHKMDFASQDVLEKGDSGEQEK